MATAKELNIALPAIKLGEIIIPIRGTSPLICHAWSKKAKGAMLDKQMGVATSGREKKDPERDFRESLYPIGDQGGVEYVDNHLVGGQWGFPAIGLKAAAITSCTSTGSITKVAARQAFHVIGDVNTDYDGLTPASGEFVQILGANPKRREDMVRIGMGTADVRFRAEFWPWHMNVKVKFNANVLTAAQVVNLFNHAGFGVGIGEWRSERDGQFGLFEVVMGMVPTSVSLETDVVETAPALRKVAKRATATA